MCIRDSGRVISLIHKYLNAGVIAKGMFERTEVGMPQGGPLSPLLSNVTVSYTHLDVYKRQMAFLMLLPNGIRVVIEIDGKQHYSKGDITSPKLYAEMMVDTRNLQLKGYEVYRFGGYEFMDSQQMKQTVRDFFEMLFKKYSI